MNSFVDMNSYVRSLTLIKNSYVAMNLYVLYQKVRKRHQ